MNRTEKEKPARIEIRLRPAEKEKIRRLAKKCSLPVGGYMVKRALGYEPRAVPPDIFYDVYNKLCEICNTAGLPPEKEERLLALIDEIHAELLLPGRERDAPWPPRASGRSEGD